MTATTANRLTSRLRSLELATEPAPGAERREPYPFVFGGRYSIRVASDLESRRRAYELVYRLYLEKEYTKPNPSKMWLSIFDALPETATLLVERTAVDGGGWKVEGQGDGVEGGGWKVEGRSNPTTSTFHHPPSTAVPEPSPSTLHHPPSTASVPIGALTVVFDSPVGLPADRLYRPELDALRASGRRVAEVTSLAVADEAGTGGGTEVLVKLFNHAYFVARGIRGATDFVITVNPRHVRFYERLMLFSQAGPEREYDKVGGAPAVLMRLDFDVAEAQRVPSSEFRVPGLAGDVSPETRNSEPGTRNRRTIYAQFRSVAEEPAIVAALAGQLRPMTGREFDYFLSARTDVLARVEPEQRRLVRAMCSPYERESTPMEPFSLK